MAGEFRQQMRTSQTLSMSPQVQQAIKILTLGRQELLEYIDEELRENPCLEQVENGSENFESLELSSTSQAEQTSETLAENSSNETESQKSELLDHEADIAQINELLAKYENSQPTEHDHERYEVDEPETPIYERIRTSETELHSALAEQLRLMHLTQYELECAEILLQYINDNGFLEDSLEVISAQESIDLGDLEYALELIQKCEPVGVGARDLQETLILQLSSYPEAPKEIHAILSSYWKEFEKQDLQKIARALKVRVEDIKQHMHWIREHLDPRPTRQFGLIIDQPVVPEVYIFKRNNEWVVSLNEEGLPRIRISPQYAHLLKELSTEKKRSAEVRLQKDFVSEKIKSARWILQSLSQRSKTILRVAEVIVEKQKPFLEKGIEYLRPLTLKDVADELELHESTISRTTSQKYVHTPRGIFELKYFFNAGLTSNNGQELANETIKGWVAEFIRNEPAENALSDQEIAELIEEKKGMKIARRTVAKYREALGILSSAKRKKIRT